MTNQEIKQIQEEYEKSLKEKIEGKTYHVSECIQLVGTIGNEFAGIASGKFGIKEFNIQQNKENYAHTLTYKIFSAKRKIVDIIISVTDEENNSLTMNEIMVDFKINEDNLKQLLNEIREANEMLKQKQLEELEKQPIIELSDIENTE